MFQGWKREEASPPTSQRVYAKRLAEKMRDAIARVYIGREDIGERKRTLVS